MRTHTHTYTHVCVHVHTHTHTNNSKSVGTGLVTILAPPPTVQVFLFVPSLTRPCPGHVQVFRGHNHGHGFSKAAHMGPQMDLRVPCSQNGPAHSRDTSDQNLLSVPWFQVMLAGWISGSSGNSWIPTARLYMLLQAGLGWG